MLISTDRGNLSITNEEQLCSETKYQIGIFQATFLIGLMSSYLNGAVPNSQSLYMHIKKKRNQIHRQLTIKGFNQS